MKKLAQIALTAALVFAPAAMIAQGPPHHNDGPHNGWDNGRGNPGRGNQHADFHFNDNDRRGFAQHYRGDYNRYHGRPNRPNPGFYAGRAYPPNVRFRPVPRGYYGNLQPPPPGYQYGYYNGYVVAYNPATRIIADVLDIAAASLR